MEDEIPFNLCADCSKDIYLKNYVKKNAKTTSSCTICLNEKTIIDICEDDFLRNLCRFLIRFHFAEYEYNPKWGGEKLLSLFYSNNPILSHKFQNLEERTEDLDDFLDNLFMLHDFSNKIPLYYGYDEFGKGLFSPAKKEEKSRTWEKYKYQLLRRNYYELEKEAIEEFSILLQELSYKLPENKTFFRARIGYKIKVEGDEISTMEFKIPFENEELSSPPVLKTKAGRANRQGVSFLYLASTKKTALGEIRPHPGHYVSIGEFTNENELKLVDLRFIDLANYFQDERKLQRFMFLNELSNELSIPILPEEKENYLVTQFISDIIRQIGFDGILYKSSVTLGFNLVIFNPENFSFKSDSSKLTKITSVSFSSREIEYDIDGFIEKAKERK